MLEKTENTKSALKRGRYVYEITRESYVSEAGEEYEGWGVRLSEGEREIAYAPDVSTQRERVSKLVEGCNEGELAPIHFYDVIDDFLL